MAVLYFKFQGWCTWSNVTEEKIQSKYKSSHRCSAHWAPFVCLSPWSPLVFQAWPYNQWMGLKCKLLKPWPSWLLFFEFFSVLDFFLNIYRNNLSTKKIAEIAPAVHLWGGKLTWQTGEERAVTEEGFFAGKPLPPSGGAARARMQKSQSGPAIL